MLTKNTIKYLKSLSQKKYRYKYSEFLAEGEKIVDELLKLHSETASNVSGKYMMRDIFATNEWYTKQDKQLINQYPVTIVSSNELKQISSLKTPNNVTALVTMPDSFDIDTISDISLLLEDIQDPGNLGTIIRIADWFGIECIYCSNNSVDVYNPKVVQSTMGALFRIPVLYCDFPSLIEKTKKQADIPIYGTFLQGENIYKSNLSKKSFIIMGNESHGISPEITKYITHPLTIPTFSSNTQTSESLNIATATAIVCSEFRRRVL